MDIILQLHPLFLFPPLSFTSTPLGFLNPQATYITTQRHVRRVRFDGRFSWVSNGNGSGLLTGNGSMLRRIHPVLMQFPRSQGGMTPNNVHISSVFSPTRSEWWQSRMTGMKISLTSEKKITAKTKSYTSQRASGRKKKQRRKKTPFLSLF